MSDVTIAESITGTMIWVHSLFLNITEDLTEAQFGFQLPNSTAPSIAWHVWHTARWADRLQAGLSDHAGIIERSSAMATELWVQEQLARQWQLDPERLGVFQTGSEMKDEWTPLIGQVGKQRVLEYVRSVFTTLNTILSELRYEELRLPRKTIANFDIAEDRSITIVPATDFPIIDELVFHFAHASRHLGMIEALRGVLLPKGTATV